MPVPTASAAPSPLSFAVAAGCLVACAHFYSVCSLFSYAGIMSADLGWAADRDHAGSVAGFLQSANVLGRLPTSVLWGVFVDRYGTRCGVALSMASLALGNVLFGICTGSASASMAIRFTLLGMGNGWATIQGPLALELGGAERQVEVSSKFFASASLMGLLGPAIGGWAYGVVPRFPALFPGLLGGLISLVALMAGLLWLPRAPAVTTKQLPLPAPSETSSPSDAGFVNVGCSWPLPLLIVLRSMFGLLMYTFFEVFPLWAISSKPLGGLALSEDDLGVVLAASALLSTLFMALAMPPMVKYFGLRWCKAASFLALGFLWALMPLCRTMATATALNSAANSLYGVLAATVFAALNNSVPQDQRSTMNGIAVMLETIGKAAGPACSSVTFSAALSEWGWSGHRIFFCSVSGAHLLLALCAWGLPPSIEGSDFSSAGAARRAAKLSASPTSAASCPHVVSMGEIAEPDPASRAREGISTSGAGGRDAVMPCDPGDVTP